MVKSIFNNWANIYIACWCIYTTQGTFNIRGSLISQMLLLVLLLSSIKEAIFVHKLVEKPQIFKGILLLLVMYTLYGLVLLLTDGPQLHGLDGRTAETYTYIKDAYMSLLPIYAFYSYTHKRLITLKSLQVWTPFLVIIAIMHFFQAQEYALQKALEMGSNREEFTNNSSYVLMALIPMMLIYERKQIMQIIGLSICVLFVIMGVKRGAIFITGILLSIIAWGKIKTASSIQKVIVIMGIIAFFIFLNVFVQDYMMQSDYFNYKLQATLEGESSQRDILYVDFIDNFLYNASVIEQLIGGGAYHTICVSFNYAHNDWLEILTNNGVLGIVLFAMFWIYFFKSRNFYEYDHYSRFAIILIFIMLFTKTLFSMSICDIRFFTSCILGFTLAGGLNNIYSNE